MFCCISRQKIAPREIEVIMDQKRATKYGISIDRYYRILQLPNMTKELVDVLHGNGWDFTDTSKDLLLFAEMQTFQKKYLPDDMDITEHDY